MKNQSKSFVPEQALPNDFRLQDNDFAWVPPEAFQGDKIVRPSLSFWQDARRRLFQNKVAVVCMITLLIIIVCAIVFPLISPYTMSEQHTAHPNTSFFYKAEDGHVHIFGTDSLGRDLFTRSWNGAQISLFIAFSAVVVNFIIGVVYGSIAGYFGGRLDGVMMRILEIIISIPYLIVVILMMTILPKGLMSIVVAYALVGWTTMARLVRGQILSLKEQEYVMAAKAMGASNSRIIMRYLVPNLLSVVIVSLTLSIPNAIFTEAFLSFIGLGVPVPFASWGTLAQDGASVFQSYPNALAVPAFLISITMLSFNLLGDGLRDAFDPKLRR